MEIEVEHDFTLVLVRSGSPPPLDRTGPECLHPLPERLPVFGIVLVAPFPFHPLVGQRLRVDGRHRRRLWGRRWSAMKGETVRRREKEGRPSRGLIGRSGSGAGRPASRTGETIADHRKKKRKTKTKRRSDGAGRLRLHRFAPAQCSATHPTDTFLSWGEDCVT